MSLNDTYRPQPDCAIGWYGKIPGNGDFVRRGLPVTLVNQWAHWFQAGLTALQLATPGNARYSLSGAPMWYFVVPCTLGTPFVQLGCMMPSRDRVGRHYPLFAMWVVPPEQWHNPYLMLAAERYYQMGQTLQRGIYQRHSAEHIDRALQALPSVGATPGNAWLVQQIVSCCTEVESGGRLVDSILTNTLLPQISHRLLAATACWPPAPNCIR